MNSQRRKHYDTAVSPVVGVMLMLVVVIIIAAVVSAFAGGQAGSVNKPPTVSMEVWIDPGDSFADTEMNFRHLGGDPVHTKDIQIITVFKNSSGYVYRHIQTSSSDPSYMYSTASNRNRLPYLADITTGKAASNPATKDFGNYTLNTGDVMTTNNLWGMAELLGIPWTRGSPFSDSHLDDSSLKPGSIITVKILHTPSGKMIFEKDVVFR